MNYKLTNLSLMCLLILATLTSLNAQTTRIMVKPAGQDLWGYCDLSGDMVIPAKFKKCTPFSSNGMAIVINPESKKYEFIDENGAFTRIPEDKYTFRSIFGFEIEGFNDGLVAIKVGKLWGFMDKTASYIITPKFTNAMSFNEGYASANIDKRFYILEANGHELPLNNSDVVDMKSYSEGLFPFKHANGKYGFIDAKGNITIEAMYAGVGYFKGGLAWVKDENNLIGYINKSGELVIEKQFAMANDFDPISKMAKVKKGETWGFVDSEGNYSTFGESDMIKEYVDGFTRGRKNELNGFMNNAGEWVIEPKYKTIRDFSFGYAAVETSDQKWGLIDKNGNWVIEPKFIDMKDAVQF